MHATQARRFLYTKALKPIFFRFKPETMHEWFGKIGHLLGKKNFTRKILRSWFHYEHPALAQEVLGLSFKNPVGLSAGFDKDVLLCHTMSDIGFGFTEIGSITWQAYDGNPKPWLYRLKKSEGLIVYYGLKNKGVHYAINKYKSYANITIPVIVSVAKTNCQRTADMEAGLEDYIASLQEIKKSEIGDMIDINISCPNAFGGEDFADPIWLKRLLTAITGLNINKPIVIKMPIDKPRQELKKLIDLCLEHNIQGVIISNLTKKREDIDEKDDIKHIPGGISGKPTQAKSNKLIGQVYQYCGDKLVIIGVGGVFTAQDAYEKIKHGASLVQLITGMIFQGPQLIGEINKGLVELLKRDGYKSISEAQGAYYR